MAWCAFIPDLTQFSRISKILFARSRSSFFLATSHFIAVPSRLLSMAVQASLSSFRLSCSRCSLLASTQVPTQPSESSLNSFDFLKVFLDLPTPLSHDSVFLQCQCLKRPVHHFPSICPYHGIRRYTCVSVRNPWYPH